MRRARSACGGLLPAPAEQTQSDEAGGEEWKSGWQRCRRTERRDRECYGTWKRLGEDPWPGSNEYEGRRWITRIDIR